jgi:hypothetical protein
MHETFPFSVNKPLWVSAGRRPRWLTTAE